MKYNKDELREAVKNARAIQCAGKISIEEADNLVRKAMGMTKKDWGIAEAYHASSAANLWHCYASFSRAKAAAEYEIKKEMADNEGYDFRVISWNTFNFTCGYRYQKDGVEYLRYHTPSGVRDIALF